VSTSVRSWPEAATALAAVLPTTGSWELEPHLPPLPWHGRTWRVGLRSGSTVGLVIWTELLPAGARDAGAWGEIANWAITRALEASGVESADLLACGPPQVARAETIGGDAVKAYGFRSQRQRRPAGALAWWVP